MAIPTWRNVEAPSSYGALNALSNANSRVERAISNLGQFAGDLDTQQRDEAAKTFDQSLSANIGQFEGDRQQYKDYLSKELRANTDLTSAERAERLQAGLDEQELYTGLSPEQQQGVDILKQQSAADLSEINAQQEQADYNLSNKLGFPIEQFDWKDDTSGSFSDLEDRFSNLKGSGMEVKEITQRIGQLLGGRKPSPAEVEGIMYKALKGDWSPLNDSSFEITDGWLDDVFGDQSLSAIVKQYKADISNDEANKQVRNLRRQQANQRDVFTTRAEDNIKRASAEARKANAAKLNF